MSLNGPDRAILFLLADMQRSVSDSALCESALNTVTNRCESLFVNAPLHRESLQIGP